jgi:hypothetical protein
MKGGALAGAARIPPQDDCRQSLGRNPFSESATRGPALRVNRGSTESRVLVNSSEDAILTARPLNGPDVAGATPEAPRVERACGGPLSALGRHSSRLHSIG